jgi:hypothetical protein
MDRGMKGELAPVPAKCKPYHATRSNTENENPMNMEKIDQKPPFWMIDRG